MKIKINQAHLTKNYNLKYSKKGGFTLIELLVVISIIGLISSIALASLNEARTKAKNAGNLRQVKEYQNAFALCSDEIKGELPKGNDPSGYNCITNKNGTCFFGNSKLNQATVDCSTPIASNEKGESEQNKNLASLLSSYIGGGGRSGFNDFVVTGSGGTLPGKYSGLVYVESEKRLYWPVINETSCKGGNLLGTGGNGVVCWAHPHGISTSY